MQVVFTPYAVRQIDELHAYIADHSFDVTAEGPTDAMEPHRSGPPFID